MWREPGSKARSALERRVSTPLREVIFAIPGDLDTPTGGYLYDRRVLALLQEAGFPIRHLALPGGYPAPSADDLAETARLVAAMPADAVLLIDGLAYGAMPEALIRGFGRAIVALVHHPLGLESGSSPERQAALIVSETRALALARHVIVTSPLTARVLASDFGVAPERITVAEPGTEPALRARGTGEPVQILAVGAVSPRKGYEVLVAALATLKDLPWQATIVGALDRNPDAVAALRHAIAGAGLADRIALAGAVAEAAREEYYRRADLFVSASLYEGYGMGLAEAMARGLPLVASTGGAADETASAGALKVPPGDVAALARALRQAIADRELRARLAQDSWAAGQRLPRWPDTSARIAHALQQVSP
jgi:glycosyltransferase involved in cell wall biosynthesis